MKLEDFVYDDQEIFLFLDIYLILNIQTANYVILQIQERVTTSTINYKRNVVSAEDFFDELLNKMRRNSEVSSQ